ncbi:hypothetical protein ACFQZ8_02765 [Micromonospora azadirachtae]|uniref:Uncharacterized protein n=1 Tax=Micromonospora azadirachtae TaxID=1970735 RepID=A0ABW2ZX14_9ACTN
MGLLEFGAEAVHDAARSYVQLLQVGVGDWPVRYAAAHGRLRVGGCRFVRLLLLEFGRVLLVDFLQSGAGAADGLGGGGERGVVGGGGVVGVPHLVDQLVEAGEVRVGGRVGGRRPHLDESSPVFL